MRGFPEWVKRHCTVFGLLNQKQVEMVASWQEIFDSIGWTAEELNAATTWLAGNAPPKFPSEHLAALHRGVGEVRVAFNPEKYAARMRAEREEEARLRAQARGVSKIRDILINADAGHGEVANG